MQIESVKAAYRRYAGVYDAVFGPVLQPGRRAVLEALGLRPGERVLEVGVGTGLSLPLYPRDVRITGIDVSREMLDKARRRVERRGLGNVEALLEMDAEKTTFAPASFDKIVAMYVMPVVDRPAAVLEEMHRVCKPDGEIFLVNHVRSQNRLVAAVENSLARFSDKIGFHSDFDLRDLVSDAGELTEVATINFLWKVLRVKNGVHHRIGEASQIRGRSPN